MGQGTEQEVEEGMRLQRTSTGTERGTAPYLENFRFCKRLLEPAVHDVDHVTSRTVLHEHEDLCVVATRPDVGGV